MERLKQRALLWLWRQVPDCAEMSRLSSRILDEPPSLKLRFQMWLHHLICVWCRRYTQQLEFLRRAAASFRHELATVPSRNLTAAGRQRIINRLRSECGH